MNEEKIYFSEWTDFELSKLKRCFCDCHSYPGVYPTDENNPCHICGHINHEGYFPRTFRDGWVKYWRSDKVGTNG